MDIDEEILKYLDGEMNGDELDNFQKRLNSEIELKNSVEEYQKLISGIKMNERDELRKKIKKSLLTNNVNQNEKIIPMKSKSIIWIAAAALLIIGAVTVMNLNGGGDPDYKKLFADNYDNNTKVTNKYLDKIGSSGFASTTEDSLVTLPDGSVITSEEYLIMEQARIEKLSNGLKLFKKSNWKDSRIALFDYTENHAFPEEDYQVALFHLAKSMLNSGDYAESANNYNKFLSGLRLDDETMDVAEFDRAIVYLQIDPKKAKNYLDVIAQDMRHTYRDTARGLSSSL